MTYKRDKKKTAAYQKAYRLENKEKLKAYFKKRKEEEKARLEIIKARVWERIKKAISVDN